METEKTPENSYLLSQKFLAEEMQNARDANKREAEQEATLRRVRIEELKSKGLSQADAETEVDRGIRVIDNAMRTISYQRSLLIDATMPARKIIVDPLTGKAKVIQPDAGEGKPGTAGGSEKNAAIRYCPPMRTLEEVARIVFGLGTRQSVVDWLELHQEHKAHFKKTGKPSSYRTVPRWLYEQIYREKWNNNPPDLG